MACVFLTSQGKFEDIRNKVISIIYYNKKNNAIYVKTEQKKITPVLKSPSITNPEKIYQKNTLKEERSSFFKLFTLRNVTNFNTTYTDIFDENYTSLGVTIAPDLKLGAPLPLFDLRGYRFMGEKYGAIAGFGVRFPTSKESKCELFGINTAYQYRSTQNGNVHQLSAGLEYITNFLEFRFNGYIPLGDTELQSKVIFNDYVGNYEAQYNFTEKVSYALNAEIGIYLLNNELFSLYFATGPYQIYAVDFFNNETGVEVFFRPRYKDILSAEIKYRYDSLFESRWEAQISLHLPLYRIGRKKSQSCSILPYQVYQPLKFIDVVPVGKSEFWDVNW